MALLWHKEAGGRRYEVRSAGRTRRLYTDGVCHSQYNPARPVTGCVWDLLTLPAFFYPPGEVQRVLVLGVGGGAVIRQLLHFVAPAEIVGLDWDSVHLYVARRFFGLRSRRLRLVQGDAREWLAAYDGPPFDLVIDDLFGGRDGEPVRAVRPNARWFEGLCRRLTPGGSLVLNCVSQRELHRSGYFSSARVRRRFPAAFHLSAPYEENAVGAFVRRPAASRDLRRRLAAIPALDPRRRSSGLRYRIRRLPASTEAG